MSKADISLDETKTEIHVVSGAVELRYTRKHPEDGCIHISRNNLPDTRIPIEYWEDVKSVLGGWHSVTSWMNASDELEK